RHTYSLGTASYPDLLEVFAQWTVAGHCRREQPGLCGPVGRGGRTAAAERPFGRGIDDVRAQRPNPGSNRQPGDGEPPGAGSRQAGNPMKVARNRVAAVAVSVFPRSRPTDNGSFT